MTWHRSCFRVVCMCCSADHSKPAAPLFPETLAVSLHHWVTAMGLVQSNRFHGRCAPLQVHVVQKPSLPDLHQLAGQLDSLPEAVAFDSLAGVLPPQLVAAAASATAAAPSRRLNRQLVDRAAAWLRTQLGLRLFGFDVVVQQTSGRHHPCCAFSDACCRQPSSMHNVCWVGPKIQKRSELV